MIKRADSGFIFICDVCDKPVAGEEGYMLIRMAEVNSVEQAYKEVFENQDGPFRTIDWASLMRLPSAAQWKAFHRECDPDPEAVCYAFKVGTCDTWPKLVHWTGHLMEKNWLVCTNWNTILMSIGEY